MRKILYFIFSFIAITGINVPSNLIKLKHSNCSMKENMLRLCPSTRNCLKRTTATTTTIITMVLLFVNLIKTE